MFKNTIPVYEFLIDDSAESGVKCISIVSQPAFGSSAVFFSNTKPKFIALADKKKQIVCGLSIIPNVLVYRIDSETGEEYNGFFSAETIEKMVNKFHDEQQGKNVNLEHNPDMGVDAYLLEDFIVNTDARVADLKSKGIEHPNIFGAWYCSYKIKDPKVFEMIENGGDSVGYSIETFLDKVLVDFNTEIKNKYINSKLKKEMKKNNKSLMEKIVALFKAEAFERSLVPELAFEIEWTEVGAPVNKVVVDPNGVETLSPVGQGEFATESGIVVVDEASVLVEVRELPEQANPEIEIEMPEVETPEVPAVSGETSISGTTVQTPLAISGDTGTESVTGDTSISGSTVVRAGIEKSILEIVGVNDGQYTVLVTVAGGVVTEATATSMVDLMLAKQTEIDALNAKVIRLEETIKLPIGDPILVPEPVQKDWSKMSAYERMMSRKGLTAV